MKKPLAPNHQPFAGKGAQEQRLPHRFALARLTKGDHTQRSMNNYAKQTPPMVTQPAMFAPTKIPRA